MDFLYVYFYYKEAEKVVHKMLDEVFSSWASEIPCFAFYLKFALNLQLSTLLFQAFPLKFVQWLL